MGDPPLCRDRGPFQAQFHATKPEASGEPAGDGPHPLHRALKWQRILAAMFDGIGHQCDWLDARCFTRNAGPRVLRPLVALITNDRRGESARRCAGVVLLPHISRL